MTQKTRAAIETEIGTLLATNGTGAITAANVRQVVTDMCDSSIMPLSDTTAPLPLAGVILSAGTAIQTTTTATNTALLQAYDTTNSVYRTFETLTAGTTPSCAIAAPTNGTLTIDGATMGGVTALPAVTATAMTTGTLTVTGTATLPVAAPVTVTAATYSLTAALNAGKRTIANRAAGIAFTLPAATGSGAVYSLTLEASITSNTLTVAAAGSDHINGVILQAGAANATNAWATTAGTNSTITLNGTTTGGLIGDKLEWVDMASGQWAVSGIISGSGTRVTPIS